MTNDAWFAGTAEPELHARLAVLRAVELRRDLVRAVNAGVASWVASSGVVVARREGPEPGVLFAEPRLVVDGEPTLYARFGDAPVTLVLALALGLANARARRARSTTARPAPDRGA